MDKFKNRIKKIRKFLKHSHVQGLLVSSPHNISYLSGFSGNECWLLLTQRENIFLGDFRYKLQAERELKTLFKILLIKDSLYCLIKETAEGLGIRDLYFESKYLSFEQFSNIQSVLPKNIHLLPCKDVVEELRMIKSEQELRYIKKAIAITKKSLRQLMPFIKAGVTEIFLKNKLEHFLKANGASAPAFETIVASGPNAAMPHARSSNRKIRKNEPVIVDVGVDYRGYKSDLTRTFFSGTITKYIKYYKLLVNAQDRAIKLVRPGAIIQKIDQAARQFLKTENLDHYFGHALGHGVGMQVHEAPHIWSKSRMRLKAGMIFTVEPGIYIPHSGGIRIEDMVLVTKKGYKVLSR